MNDPIQVDIAMIRFDYKFSGAGAIFGSARILTVVASQFISRCQLTNGHILTASQMMLWDKLWVRRRPESGTREYRNNQCAWPLH
jgi:hypothetical protein